jgi:hypothetical protein
MGIENLSFNETLKHQVRRLLPYLDNLKRRGARYVLRPVLLRESGLTDNELQKLIHDGHMPRHGMKVYGQKAYEVDTTLERLAQFCQAYEYLVEVH